MSFRILLCALAILVVPTPRAQSQSETPNILIIYADEFRFDCLGAMGNSEIETPHLDALAADGVLYRNSFCTWPVCTPSRISLLTGQYVRQHGGRTNRAGVPPNTPTFATILRNAGYRTAAVGKMHLTPAYQDVGFDTMILAEQNGPGRNVDDYHRYLRSQNLVNALDLIDQERRYRERAPETYWETFGAQVSDLPDEHHITTWAADRAMDQLETWGRGTPGLLMVGFLKPHHPFDPPAPWHERYDPATTTILPGWTESIPPQDTQRARGYFDNASLTPEALQRITAYYYATITHMDHHIGRMIQSLRERGLYDNTLIVFTADHGEYLGFHHMILKGNHMYDPLIKVPLIIKYPQQRHAGSVSDELVNALDITATILNESKEIPARGMMGQALGIGGPGSEQPREVIFAEDRFGIMARTRDTKLLFSNNDSNTLFFDLEADPFEMENRLHDPIYRDAIENLKESALRWLIGLNGSVTLTDTGARLVKGENVPTDLEQTEQEMLEYFDVQLDTRLRQTP